MEQINFKNLIKSEKTFISLENEIPLLKGHTMVIYGCFLSKTDKEKDNRERPSPFAAVVEAWNALNLSPIRKITGERERLLKARIKEYGEDGILEAIGKIKESDFLQGHGDRGWVITFDWFLGPRNFAKVLEGNYSNKPDQKNNAPSIEELRYIEKHIVKKPPKMACAPQTAYSDDEWEKVMKQI